VCAWFAGDLATAGAQIERTAPLAEGGDPEVAVWIVNTQGNLRLVTDGPHAAEPLLRHAVALVQSLTAGRSSSLAMSLNNLAMALLCAHRPAEALQAAGRARAALALAPRDGGGLMPQLLHTYGAALLAVGRTSEAREQFLIALDDVARHDNREVAREILAGLACAADIEGMPATCLMLLAAARTCGSGAFRATPANLLSAVPVGEAERRSRAALGAVASRAAWEAGARMSLQETLECARRAPAGSPSPLLPPRKLEIVRLVAAGHSNKDIAARLPISQRTVDAHLEQLRKRLGFSNRAQVAAWAVAQGLTRPAPDTS
jgi:DNA-binding CsgD family transcriptional regulator